MTSADDIRVLVADDHELMRSGVRHALESAEGLRLVAEAKDGQECLQAVEEHKPDVLLLDIRMPKLDGFAVLERVTAEHPDTAVLMLSVEDDRKVAIDFLQRGASGYVVKSVRPSDLAAAIRQAAEGTVYMGGPGLTQNGRAQPKDKYGLTDRELEILRLVAEGAGNQEIAGQLFVSVKTVKFHLTNIFTKLGAKNRTEAAAVVHREGL